MSLLGADVRKLFLPYCLQRVGESGKRYVILNRAYKPLGFYGDHVDYEDFAVELSITKGKAMKMSYDGSPDLQDVYFYNGGCIPTRSAKDMKAYLERLAVLMAIGVKGPVNKLPRR